MRRILAVLVLCSCALPVFAAESFDACAGYIDTLPANISTQGTWCLRKDLATAVTSGAAITVATNNVTIDCNGFKLGGLAAGPASQAAGIEATDRLNATVRNCAIRGFHTGVRLLGTGGGHLVEDNRIDQSLGMGVRVDGDGNLIQRNRLFDTGTAGAAATGIQAEADIIDNVIEGLVGADVIGIYVGGLGTEVRHNRIRQAAASHLLHGVITFGAQISIVDNRIINNNPGPESLPNGIAILAPPVSSASFCRDNLVAGYPDGILYCEDIGGNVVHGAAPP